MGRTLDSRGGPRLSQPRPLSLLLFSGLVLGEVGTKFRRDLRGSTCCSPSFVPSPGCLGTAAALTYGLYCFHRGQSQRSQLMMRTRIAAQGFTVAAILLGLAASAMKSRP